MARGRRTPSASAVMRYILPFSYDTAAGYEHIYEAMLRNETWEESSAWAKDENGTHLVEQEVYDYILYQFKYDRDASNIGTIWKYRDVSSLPVLTYEPGTRREERAHVVIRFIDMGLYLFRSGICLLWYEVDPGSLKDDPKDLIVFQNAFKELCASSFNRRKASRVRCLKNGEEEPFILGELIDSIVSGLPVDSTYFAMRRTVRSEEYPEGRILPDKTAVFSYYSHPFEGRESELPDNDEELSDWAYRLASGHSETIHAPSDISSTFYRPFRNVYWNITNEGCGCCVKYSSGNGFYGRPFADRIRSDYFLIYILLLHQYYSLLRYATWIQQEMPAEGRAYSRDSVQNRAKLEGLLLDLNTFLSKNVYASVSHINHHNELYMYGLDRLHIRENISSISLGTDAVSDILKVQEDRRESESDRSTNLMFGLLSLLVVFSALTDAYSAFKEQRILDAFGQDGLVTVLVIIIAGITAIVLFNLAVRSLIPFIRKLLHR